MSLHTKLLPNSGLIWNYIWKDDFLGHPNLLFSFCRKYHPLVSLRPSEVFDSHLHRLLHNCSSCYTVLYAVDKQWILGNEVWALHSNSPVPPPPPLLRSSGSEINAWKCFVYTRSRNHPCICANRKKCYIGPRKKFTPKFTPNSHKMKTFCTDERCLWRGCQHIQLLTPFHAKCSIPRPAVDSRIAPQSRYRGPRN